jgi:DNA-binding NarL/FixJ family response regulator
MTIQSQVVQRAANAKLPRISVVDDEPDQLAFFKDIADLGHFELVGLYPNASDALEHVPRRPPDLVVMDMWLPDMSGIECTKRLTTILPQLAVIVLTGHPDNEIFFRAIMNGARGFLVKPCGIEETVSAIRDVLRGGIVLGKEALPYLARIVRQFRFLDPGSSLTEREEQILACIFEGKFDKQIAETLGIGLATVRTHTNQIFKKMDVHSKAELIAKFLKVTL